MKLIILNCDHFTCSSANVIYCMTRTLCKKLYIGETGRQLGDRFREHLGDVGKDDKNTSVIIYVVFNPRYCLPLSSCILIKCLPPY